MRSSYQSGDLYVLENEAGESLGLVLTLPAGDGAVELKSVAVAPERHNQGIGKRMLALVLDELRARGTRRAIVGTGNSGIG